jgi:hypothetical protein
MKQSIDNLHFQNRIFTYLVIGRGESQLINADSFVDDGKHYKMKNPCPNTVEVHELFVLIGNGNLVKDSMDEIAYNIILEISSQKYYVIMSQEFQADYKLVEDTLE